MACGAPKSSAHDVTPIWAMFSRMAQSPPGCATVLTLHRSFSGRIRTLNRELKKSKNEHKNTIAAFLAMKLVVLLAVVALLAPGRAFAQEKKAVDSNKPKEVAAEATKEKPKATTEQLEARFKATLTKATMSGRWCTIKDGVLGPEKEDKYTIVGVSKLVGDTWLINARIQYGTKDIVAPIPVQVKWAGDTPVLVVDNIPVPGGGVYSARVLIYQHTYAGTWTGGDHGGLLNGVITNEKE